MSKTKTKKHKHKHPIPTEERGIKTSYRIGALILVIIIIVSLIAVYAL
ncbi:MAG: hypothetical protein RR614_06010 [Eubacterium sp.]